MPYEIVNKIVGSSDLEGDHEDVSASNSTEELEETVATEAVVEETTEAPAEEAAPVVEQKKADPCEAKVKAFEKWVDEFKAAQKNKANGAKELKAFSEMLKQAADQEATVKECVENADYKTRVQNAIMQCKQIRSQK